MTPRLDVIEIVVADMAASLAFYRLLGLDIPDTDDESPHVEVSLPGGMRMAFDTQETIRSFDPAWTPPAGGHGVALAFDCDDPAGVDATHEAVVAAGHRSHLAPWDTFWGQRYASGARPRWQHDRPVRTVGHVRRRLTTSGRRRRRPGADWPVSSRRHQVVM